MLSVLNKAKEGLSAIYSNSTVKLVTKNVNAFVNSVKPFCTSLYSHRSQIYERMKRNLGGYSVEAIGVLSSFYMNKYRAFFPGSSKFNENYYIDKFVFNLLNFYAAFFISAPLLSPEKATGFCSGVMEGAIIDEIELPKWANAALFGNYIIAGLTLSKEGNLEAILPVIEKLGKFGLASIGFSSGGALGAAAVTFLFEAFNDVGSIALQQFSQTFMAESRRLN